MGLRPKEGECVVCGNTFLCAQRKQGGGIRQKYCSANCRSLDWARGNANKRREAVIKYESVPENKERKSNRARERRLAEYGWTSEDLQKELVRQNYSCYGCLTPIDKRTARIDHDHRLDVVRGLLCDSCNWVLGHAKDNPATLRRLMAYLDHDRLKTSVYLIGALKNTRVPELGNVIRNRGYDVMDEWYTPGPEADTNWQAYETQRGRSYSEALRGRAATNIFLFDRSYIDLSDVVILVAPAGKSAMLELGYAKGRGKKTCIFLDGQDPERYDIMPRFADKVVKEEIDLLLWLKNCFEPSLRAILTP